MLLEISKMTDITLAREYTNDSGQTTGLQVLEEGGLTLEEVLDFFFKTV